MQERNMFYGNRAAHERVFWYHQAMRDSDRSAAFKTIPRREPGKEPPAQRRKHWREYQKSYKAGACRRQCARCMDCGTPFCQYGCPLANQIPEWNELISRRCWRTALERLHATNNFPEFTGRVCPAPCEPACTLNHYGDAVAIKSIERTLIDRGWRKGWIQPVMPDRRSGKCVVVVGSGPAGLACAQQLARAGHDVTVMEKQDRIGGLLRYGIPDFRLDKQLLDRRLAQMRSEGVRFMVNVEAGLDMPLAQLQAEYDAVVLACGAEQPRDLAIPGRGLSGIHVAMDFLRQQNRRLAGDRIAPAARISATGKHVVIIGGGDTGADCVGVANRQRAVSVVQVQYHEQPPRTCDQRLTWPDWPNTLRNSDSHLEGCNRLWNLSASRFIGRDGHVRAVKFQPLQWENLADGTLSSQAIGEEQQIAADLVLLAMGFAHTLHNRLTDALQLDARGNVMADEALCATEQPGLFCCGDMRRGQSLVVWAIHEGRTAARAIDSYLTGSTILEP